MSCDLQKIMCYLLNFSNETVRTKYFYIMVFKLKLSVCTNLCVFVQVYPTGLLFAWNDLIQATFEQKLIFKHRFLWILWRPCLGNKSDVTDDKHLPSTSFDVVRCRLHPFTAINPPLFITCNCIRMRALFACMHYCMRMYAQSVNVCVDFDWANITIIMRHSCRQECADYIWQCQSTYG